MIGILMAMAILGAYLLGQPLSFLNFALKDVAISRSVQGVAGAVTGQEKKIPERETESDPAIAATVAAAYDTVSRFRLWGQQVDEPRPIASITKLMTALVFLEHNPGWKTSYTLSRADYREGGKINLFPGDTVTVRDIFRTALIASDNVAIAALVRASGMSEQAFVAAMNQKAQVLNLKHTGFFDPTGLDARTISTAHDVARFANAAFSQADIKEALTRPSYDFITAEGNKKHILTTDRLLVGPIAGSAKLIAGKTGYLPEAGYCFVGQFEKDGHIITTVVLGAADETARFAETKKMVEWAYTNFSWK